MTNLPRDSLYPKPSISQSPLPFTNAMAPHLHSLSGICRCICCMQIPALIDQSLAFQASNMPKHTRLPHRRSIGFQHSIVACAGNKTRYARYASDRIRGVITNLLVKQHPDGCSYFSTLAEAPIQQVLHPSSTYKAPPFSLRPKGSEKRPKAGLEKQVSSLSKS